MGDYIELDKYNVRTWQLANENEQMRKIDLKSLYDFLVNQYRKYDKKRKKINKISNLLVITSLGLDIVSTASGTIVVSLTGIRFLLLPIIPQKIGSISRGGSSFITALVGKLGLRKFHKKFKNKFLYNKQFCDRICELHMRVMSDKNF